MFDELPEKYRDTAFLDRLHCYIPGWEVETLRGEMFTDGYGFIVDFYAEILQHLRHLDYSLEYQDRFELNPSIAQRDLDGVKKTFSGLMKLIFPHKECSDTEMAELLEYAVEGRKRVKSQLLKMDETYAPVTFSFTNKQSKVEHKVKLLEEEQYQRLFSRSSQVEVGEGSAETASSSQPDGAELKSGLHIQIKEN